MDTCPACRRTRAPYLSWCPRDPHVHSISHGGLSLCKKCTCEIKAEFIRAYFLKLKRSIFSGLKKWKKKIKKGPGGIWTLQQFTMVFSPLCSAPGTSRQPECRQILKRADLYQRTVVNSWGEQPWTSCKGRRPCGGSEGQRHSLIASLTRRQPWVPADISRNPKSF